jgi:hypothetical protein
MENFTLMSAHFKTWMEHAGVTWGGEVLIPAAGAANVPKLMDANLEAIRRAGTELRDGVISEETMNDISEVGITPEDYRKMVNANFAGGIGGTVKVISLGAKMMREKEKKHAKN